MRDKRWWWRIVWVMLCMTVLMEWLPGRRPQVHASSALPALPSAAELAALPPDGGPRYNRLVFEQSPYLLQHATNPIDWYPWGDAAFAKARQENKPIFLSIGYSTCHWCHVMERESFANADVARIMNQHFVAIKVDREERPDLDHLYMEVCQRMSQHCGWPLNLIMTPERKPFFVSTYLPRQARFGRPGMLELLPRVHTVWSTRQQEIAQLAERVVASLDVQPSTATGQTLDEQTLAQTYTYLSQLFDAEHGGIGGAPKFPKPLMLGFLLRYWKRTGEAHALAMVEQTLQAMRRGGMYDHIGFGFHRYATDAAWLVPHFEKMLYNQALLLLLYTETFQATGKPLYAQTAREIATYVLRDMTAPEGGFYSAEDADSEGEEGLFYFWTTQEIYAALGKDEGELFVQAFNLQPDGNFKEGMPRKHNIPHLRDDLQAIAAKHTLTPQVLRQRLEASRQRLFARRKTRVHPLKDDKILTDWNGLMIAAFAKAGQALGEPVYVTAAQRAATFILSTLRDANGRLHKRYRNGEASLPGHVNDYAFLIWGLLELYEATFTVDFLEAAIDLQKIMLEYFWDDKEGGFFYTASDGERLLKRSKDIADMSLPSGNAVAASNLLRLERMTANTQWADKAAATLRTFATQVASSPPSHTLLLSALDFALGPSFEVVISGVPDRADTQAMFRALRQAFMPNKVVVFRPGDVPNPAISRLAPYTRTQKPLQGKATAYVCQNYVCNRPTTDPQAMLTALGLTAEIAAPEVPQKP